MAVKKRGENWWDAFTLSLEYDKMKMFVLSSALVDTLRQLHIGFPQKKIYKPLTKRAFEWFFHINVEGEAGQNRRKASRFVREKGSAF